ncbi:MAG: Shedu anti-phage system protein SduA domain-containing protein [Chloroflexota bacterium]
MPIMKEYAGRAFSKVSNFETIERIPGRPSSNYLTTIENGYVLNKKTGEKSDKAKFRIQRWRAINDKNDISIKYWEISRNCQHFNINSVGQLEDISNIVNDLVEGVEAQEIIKMSVEDYDRLHRNLRQEKSKIRKLLAEILNLKGINSIIAAERQTFKQRLSEMKANIGNYESVLLGYKKLISNETTNETDVKDYLENNHAYWMFGLEYIDIKREVGVPFGKGKKDFFLDFMLQRHDGYLDFVECKGPNENLFDKRTRKRTKPNEKLAEAIGQVFKYLYAIDKTWDENVIKPKAYILIGKQEKDQPSERRIFSSYLSNTEIITYSELCERGRRLLKHIKLGKW